MSIISDPIAATGRESARVWVTNIVEKGEKYETHTNARDVPADAACPASALRMHAIMLTMITKRQISVKVGYTYNLGDYSNIRPEVMISGEISDEDTTGGAIRHLQEQAIQACYRQIDEHLEKTGQPAEFSDEARYSAHVWKEDRLILLMPAEVFEDYERQFHTWNHHTFMGYRLEHLQELLEKRYLGYRTHEYSNIPDRDDVPQQCFLYETDNAIFVGKGSWNDLPNYIRKYQKHYDHVERLWTAFWGEIEQRALEQGKPLIAIDDPKDEEELLNYAEAEALKVRYEEEQAQKAQEQAALSLEHGPEDDPFDDDYDDEDDEDEYDDDDDE